MRPKDREFFYEETGRRLQSMLRRFGGTHALFPRLRPGLSHAALRRTVHRLRTGAVHSVDPRIPSHVLADLLEGSITQDMLIRSVVADMHELRELEESLGRRSR
jgi:hypothetical protein